MHFICNALLIKKKFRVPTYQSFCILGNDAIIHRFKALQLNFPNLFVGQLQSRRRHPTSPYTLKNRFLQMPGRNT